jgi:hypothetical protein
MQGDMSDGSFSEAELKRLEAEGIIEIHQAGTPKWRAHTQAIADELEAHDAELLAHEGPDALTSERLLRQTALAVERDPDFVGYAFAAWCAARGWERSDLADYLGVTVSQLAAMAIIARADYRFSMDANGSEAKSLARQFGADASRLAQVLAD